MSHPGAAAPEPTAAEFPPSRLPLYGLWGSAGFSISGNTMVSVLVPWLVLRLTGSPAYAGLIEAAALGAAVLALFAGGALLDRWDRRRLSVGADLLSAVSVAAIPIIEHFGGLTLAVITALVAIGALFDGPGAAAREALRPPAARATKTSLPKVASYGEVMDSIGEVAGPALAGLTVAIVGLNASFWVATAIFVIAAGIMWLGVPSWPADTRRDQPYLEATLDGLKVVWRDPVLRGTGLVLSLFGFFITPLILVLTVEFEANDRAAALGFVIAAFAVGGIAGAVLFASVSDRVRRRPALLGSFALASIGLGSMALALDSVVALVLIATATGFLAGPINPVLSLITLDRASDEYRGRVLATLGALWLVAGSLSAILAGILIQATSTEVALLIIGVGSLAVTGFASVTPGLRHIESSDLVSEAGGSGD
jgi:MFS family permease